MRIPCVARVDVAPFLERLRGLTVEDGLRGGLGINRVPAHLGQRGLRGTRRGEQALAGGNACGNARTDALAERPEAFCMDMPGFATLRRQPLVVHRHERIQERCVPLDENTEQAGVTPRGGQPSHGMDIVAPCEPRQVRNDARTDIPQVDLVTPPLPDAMIAVEVGFDGRRGGFGRILLQGREGGLRLPRPDLQ
jgi:hypothetical protein